MREHWIIKINSVVIIGLLGFTSCYYDVEEDIYTTIECKTMDMSYANDILPIIVDNCYRCHDAANNFGNITLEGYDLLKQRADSGQLVGAINREPGFSPMPQNSAKLLDCNIEKIEAWINSGAPNN